MREQLFFDNWVALSKDEKISIMQEVINEKCLPMTIKSVKTFELNNLQFETVVFEMPYKCDKNCENEQCTENEPIEFIFVPGKKQQVLGWDSKTCKIEDEIIKFMEQEFLGYYEWWLIGNQEEIDYLEKEIEKAKQHNNKEKQEEYEQEIVEYRENVTDPSELKTIEEWLEYLDKNTTPIRTVDIMPMIVEVYPRGTEEINTELSDIFSFPTEDEWEYLYGGGSRSLFPWYGKEQLETALDVTLFMNVWSTKNDERHAKINKFVNESNAFGLFFDLDTYTGELVSSGCFSKGSDGGGSVCGGDGLFYVAPVISTFYSRNIYKIENYMQLIENRKIPENRCLYRRVIRL